MRLRLTIVTIFALLGLGVGASPARAGDGGAVFTMSNGVGANRVLSWARTPDGNLSFVGSTSTGGRGTGGPLNDQGAMFLSPNGRWLLVVNAGSDDLSILRVHGASLTLVDRVTSHGDRPISVTAAGRLAYVLNAGGAGNVRGFRRGAGGELSFIVGSGRPLSRSGAGPVQIGFTPDGAHLVVSERFSDRLSVYEVDASGIARGPTIKRSAGREPFGFDFGPDGTLVVSEAAGHVPDGSSASSYRFRPAGSLRTVSAAVPTTETAACWTAVTPNGRYAYVTNTPDHSISGFRVGDDGALIRLDGNGVTAATGPDTLPIDLDTSADGDHLYVLAAGTDEILAYRIEVDGALVPIPGVHGLPGAAVGLVAR